MLVREKFENTKYIIYIPETCNACLWWLHGYHQNIEDIIEKMDLTLYAEKEQTALIVPDLTSDTYYMNHPWRNLNTEDWFIQQFIPYIRDKYRLPEQKDKNYLGGASMGGFGSLLIGSHYPDIFGKIVSLSGAFIIDDVLKNEWEVTFHNLKHFEMLFGKLETLKESVERNPLRAAEYALRQGKTTPIFMTCGKKDLLYPRNVKMYSDLKDAGANVTWIPQENGTHSNEFLNSVLKEVFLWLED